MRILCSRDPADRQGSDIVDSLLTSDAAGVARGTGEVNYSCTNRESVRGNCPLLPYMKTGKLVNVTEGSGSYKGKLTAFSIIIDIDTEGKTFTASSAVTIEKEMS